MNREENQPKLPPAKIIKGHFLSGDKDLPTPKCQLQLTNDHVIEMAKCASDICYFAENYFFIENMDEGEMKIQLYPAQRRVLKSMVDTRFSVVRASRQIGKCLVSNELCKIRDKKTGVVKEISMKEFYESKRLISTLPPNK